MSWRSLGIAAINLICIAMPYNIIGCGPYPNPFDNYISFVGNDLTNNRSLKPFYYVRDTELYDPFAEPPSKGDNCADWVGYGKHNYSIGDAHYILCKADIARLRAVCRSLEKGRISKIPLPLRQQPMLDRLIHTRDTAALQYILFARQTQPWRMTAGTPWDSPPPTAAKRVQDSIACSRLADEALIRSRRTRNPFISTRYAYLATSLSFYSHRYTDCIRICQTGVHPTSAGSLYPQALSFQAGAAYHSNRKPLAAYAYSRAFALGGPNISDYRGFTWSIDRKSNAPLTKAMALCNNSRERADMLALYSLGSILPEERSLREIYKVDPTSSILEVLTFREVHKLEQNDLSKRIKQQPGGLTMYVEYDYYDDNQPSPTPWRAEARSLSAWFDSVAQDPRVPHPAVYKTMAAYLCYIQQDYTKAAALLDQAARMPASAKLRAQQQITRLLVAINTMDRLDKSNEEKLLPAIKWLEKWSQQDKDSTASQQDYPRQRTWQRIYRNLLAEMIARRYYQQGDSTRKILAIGAAEKIIPKDPFGYEPDFTLTNIRQYFSANECRRLWDLIHARKQSPWEKYLTAHFPISDNKLIKTTATAMIREYRWQEALQWMNRLHPSGWFMLQRNPFIESPNDRIDTIQPSDRNHCDKRQFVKIMLALTRKENTGRAAAEDLYKLAIGYYNMSHYGRAQRLVDYYGSADQWDELPTGRTSFEKEYYGCYTAEEYALKAQAASKNKEFKARCQFLAAKCEEKKIRLEFDHEARNNRYFYVLLHQYRNTSFYREAFNTCSYLRDFVKKNQ